ncbi:ATP-grasp domain-containing protein [Kitasatospora sp. NPDC059722]|uniref:ATP-grasp domain-containing protein n=1 Tax=Kitasatospora sp. NPDC059722 TaxID=3346925 RepID=UPI00368A3EEE
MKKLLLIGVGQMGRPYVAAAGRLGVSVHAVEAASRADRVTGTASVAQARGELDEHWMEGACLALQDGPFDGVIAFNEPQVIAAAMIQDRFGLPGPSLHAATASRNKALQRALFTAAGITQPAYTVTDSLAEEMAWAAERWPVIVKPLSSAGSAGVELVTDAESFRAVAQARAGERVIVEEAIDGPEYSWEALVRDGEVWFANVTAKETTGPPQFVEVGHRTGVHLPEPSARQVADTGARVLRAMGIRTGLVHMEFRLSAAGPVPIEVAVRTPGDYLMDLLGATYGIDWYEMVVRMAVGMPLPQPPVGPFRHAASIFTISEPGVVQDIRGLEAVRSHPSVLQAGVEVEPGDTVLAVRSSGHRTGEVVLAAPSSPELESAIAFVQQTLVVTTVSPHSAQTNTAVNDV